MIVGGYKAPHLFKQHVCRLPCAMQPRRYAARAACAALSPIASLATLAATSTREPEAAILEGRFPQLEGSLIPEIVGSGSQGALLAMKLACSQPHRANSKLPALTLTSGSPSLLAQTTDCIYAQMPHCGTVDHAVAYATSAHLSKGRGRDNCTSSPYSSQVHVRIISTPPHFVAYS